MAAGRSLADKLNRLFTTVVPAGRGPYTTEEVAHATGLSKSYVQYLRNGDRDNPTKQTIEVLAAFFGVPVAYFFDDAQTARIDDQLDSLALLAALRREDVRRVASRLQQLSGSDLSMLAAFVDRFIKDRDAGGADDPSIDSEPDERR